MNPSEPGVFCLGRLLIIDSISFMDICLFRLSIQIIFIFLIYFERDRDRDSVRGGGAEREGDREGQCGARCEAQTHDL